MNGRVAVTSRALERAVAAIAAARMGVPVRDISIRLSDDAGLLAIAVTGPLTARALRVASPSDSPPAGIRTRTDTIRADIRSDVGAIAGSAVGRVSIEVSRVVIAEQRRVL